MEVSNRAMQPTGFPASPIPLIVVNLIKLVFGNGGTIMILVIDALNQDKFQDVIDEMFQLRARVFGDRLGWDVQIENGRERDQFDDLNPAYLIGLNNLGNVISCVRALQTTGPHMLSDVFQSILNGEPPLRSATIWESTRFCVDTVALQNENTSLVSIATCELMIGSLEYAKKSGIADIITVIDPVMNRVLKRSNCAPYDYIGIVAQMGKVPAMAALLDCTDERIARVRAFAGITGNVFLTDAQARALVDAKSAAGRGKMQNDLTQSEIAAYCAAQLASARDEGERIAAQRLISHLIEKGLHPAH
jgi:acyl homoserine lactone synthase